MKTTAPPTDLFFKGRPEDPRLGEWVRRESPAQTKPVDAKARGKTFVLLGYPDDLGVLYNQGRVGASAGPDSIRKHLYKMTLPADKDWSSIICLDWGNLGTTDDILENHRQAEALSRRCAELGLVGIFLGGGHDYAAPSFLGAASASKDRWGLINVDPHLDVRPLENNLPNSGTAFRTLLESGRLSADALYQFGARPNRNSRSNWSYCTDRQVAIDTWESIQVHEKRPSELFGHRLWQLQSRTKRIGVTFDMDACSEAEGTSAAPVLGFSAWQMVDMAGVAGRCLEVGYLEIAEVNPLIETADRASRIAAEMIYAFVSARVSG